MTKQICDNCKYFLKKELGQGLCDHPDRRESLAAAITFRLNTCSLWKVSEEAQECQETDDG